MEQDLKRPWPHVPHSGVPLKKNKKLPPAEAGPGAAHGSPQTCSTSERRRGRARGPGPRAWGALTGGVGRQARRMASELECSDGYLCSGRVGCMAK